MESDSFQLAGHVWSFKIRPCGRSDAPDDVSLFLVYNGAASFGTAFLNMLMLNNTTVAYTLKLQRLDGTTISEETQLNTFVVGQDLGSRHFANRQAVLDATKGDDTVIVRLCDVRVVDTAAAADNDGASWTIPRFGELVRCTKEDHHMQSDSFDMDGEQWRFWIYPCGQSSAQDGISLFLQYTGSRSVTAVFTLQLKQADGTIIDHVTYSHLFAPEDTWGSRPFAERQTVLDCIGADDKLVTRVCNFRKVDRSTTKRDGMTLWKIPRFSHLVKCSKTDLLVESDLFEMEGEQWRLMVKPSGATEAAGDIAAYLRYLGAAASVTASYTLVLLRSDTNAAPLATRAFAAHKFGPDTSWGTNTIANRDTITADIEDDDTLIVAVTEMEIPDTQVGAEEALEAAEQWFAEQRWRDAANAYTKAMDAGYDKVSYIHQRKAFCFNELERHADALKEWDAAVRAAPDCPFSRCKRGEQHLKLGRMKKAEKDAMHALKLRPEYPEATELLKNATNSAALVPTKTGKGKAPATVVTTSECQDAFDEARRQEDAGNWTVAIASYIRAITAGYPQLYACHNRQGICYTKLGQHEEAFHQFDTAVSLAPQEATLYYNRGRQHLVLGRLKEAEADSLKALELKPDHQLAKKLQEDACKKLAVPSEARDAFANAKRLEDKGDWSAAIAAYSRALEAGYPQPFSCHNKQGICYAKLGLHEEAFRQFDTAVNLAPSDVASLRNRARKHQLFGRLREAEKDALRAVEIKPDNAAGRKLLDDIRTLLADSAEQSFQHAQTLRLRKQFIEAIEAYTKAVESGHPNLFTCYNNRSLCHTMLGQHEQALADNNHCIKEDPTDPMGYDHRARTYMDLGKLELAEKDALMTLELDQNFDGADEFLESVQAQLKVPVDARSAFNKATALYKQDDKWDQAAAQFLRAIKAGHNEAARCHLYRGSCFEKLGRLKQCMQEYMQAVAKGQDDYRGWFTRGVTYRRMGKSREATIDCNRGMELASASILSNPGLLDEILGPDVAKAIEELSDREQHRAVRPLAASMMAKTLFAMKIWEAAAAAYTLMFKPAGSIEPMGVKILPPPQIMHQGHHDRGICYQNLDRHKEAFEDFNAAVKGQPTNSSAWFRRAQEQAALGCFHEAEADLHQAISLSPHEPGTKELLDVVRRKLKSKKSDAEATQNALLAELEEEAERAAKKKEKKKRQKQKKKQQKKGKEKPLENDASNEPVPEKLIARETEEPAEGGEEEKQGDEEEYEEQEQKQHQAAGSGAENAPASTDSGQPGNKRATGRTERQSEPTGKSKGGRSGVTGGSRAGHAATSGTAAALGVERQQSPSDSDSDAESPEPPKKPTRASRASNGPQAPAETENRGKKGRPRTVQEAMTASGFERLKKTGGWQNDLCGPQPLTAISELVRQSGRNGLKLSSLADLLKGTWKATSINVAALGCYVRHYERAFDIGDADQHSVKGVPPAIRAFSASSIVVLKSFLQNESKGVGKSSSVETVGDIHAVSEADAVQLLVDHIMSRSIEGKVTKMSALAGLFLNAKDKAILSRFGDLRPVLLKHDGTFRNFLRHHSNVFRITEDPRMGDCVVEVYSHPTPVRACAAPADDWSTVSRKRGKDSSVKEQREVDGAPEENESSPAQISKDKRVPHPRTSSHGVGSNGAKPMVTGGTGAVAVPATASANQAAHLQADSGTGRKAKAHAKGLKAAADAKELLSEMEVVKLLVEKIQQRARDGKPSTKASALAGGLFQSDGRYGDLRPVLLKYEGTIHGFLRHHHEVFMLVPVDEKGRASSDDPIVRVKSKDAVEQLLQVQAQAASASIPEPDTKSIATSASRLPRENPWKQIDRQPTAGSAFLHNSSPREPTGTFAGDSSSGFASAAAPSAANAMMMDGGGGGPRNEHVQQHFSQQQFPGFTVADPTLMAAPHVSSGLSPPRSGYSPVRASSTSPLSSGQPDSPLRMSATDMLPTAFFDDDDDDDLDMDGHFQGGAGAPSGVYGGSVGGASRAPAAAGAGAGAAAAAAAGTDIWGSQASASMSPGFGGLGDVGYGHARAHGNAHGPGQSSPAYSDGSASGGSSAFSSAGMFSNNGGAMAAMDGGGSDATSRWSADAAQRHPGAVAAGALGGAVGSSAVGGGGGGSGALGRSPWAVSANDNDDHGTSSAVGSPFDTASGGQFGGASMFGVGEETHTGGSDAEAGAADHGGTAGSALWPSSQANLGAPPGSTGNENEGWRQGA